jgi:hypothetical protein
MEKQFICLANSNKSMGRCLAGIEVSEPQGQVWIRPVSKTYSGALPIDLVKDIRLLNVVTLDITETCPDGYQVENVFFNTESLRTISSIAPNNELCDNLVTDVPTLFGDTYRSISTEVVSQLNYSILFIKPTTFTAYIREYDGKLFGAFTYRNSQYYLPITDPEFKELYYQNPQIFI